MLDRIVRAFVLPLVLSALVLPAERAQATVTFSPASAPGGATITVTENQAGMNNTAVVLINGIQATTTFVDANHLRAVVPDTASTGALTIQQGIYQDVSFSSLYVIPTFSAFSANGGTIGQTITLTGRNFNSTPTRNVVTFNGISAKVLTAAWNQLTVALPANATTGPIRLFTDGYAATGGSQGVPYTIPCPTANTVTTISSVADNPLAVAFDASGNLYYTQGSAIFERTPAGVVTTFAGSEFASGNIDGAAANARFGSIDGIAIDGIGTVYVADSLNHTIRKISGGTVSTFAGVAGTAGYRDGATNQALFNHPIAVAATNNGIYVSDANNYVVRFIPPNADVKGGVVSTVAGTAGQRGSADGSPGFFSDMRGIAVDQFGAIYVADGNAIRKATTQLPSLGSVTTWAGSVSSFGTTDGAGASALFWQPRHIAVDQAGNLFVADSSNMTVREISYSGVVSTIAGKTNVGGDTDGVGNAAQFVYPYGLAVDAGGNIVVTELNTSMLRKIVATSNCPAPTCTGASVSLGVVPNGGSTQTVTVSGLQNTGTVQVTTFNTDEAATVNDKYTVTATLPGSTATLAIPLSQFDPTTPIYGNFESDVSIISTYYNNGAPQVCGTPLHWIRQLPPPSAVTLPASPVHTATVPINWSENSGLSKVDYYSVKRGLQPTGTGWTQIGTPSVKTLSDELQAQNTYYYEVAACSNTAGCSPYTVSSGLTLNSPASVTLQPPAAEVDDSAPTHDATVGTLGGKASTDGGAAMYSIPIVVPPGRSGLQPELALNYSSRNGSGTAGLGWSISGQSAIHRCPKTLEQDGVVGGVTFTADSSSVSNDRLCLDGQRLVAVSGSYGKTGTIYKTEIDGYSRITQVAGSGLTDDTACFRVEQKNGRILHYGGVVSSDGSSCTITPAYGSRVKTLSTTPLRWLLEKMEDRVGNNMLYQYTSYASGESLLTKISYTGFGAAAGNRTVTLAYQARTATSGVNDYGLNYLAGGYTMQTQELSSITTAVGTETERTYTPTYAASSYNGRLLMTKLQECAFDGAGSHCHPQTRFVYNDSGLNFSAQNLASLVGLPAGNVGNVDARNPDSFTMIGDLDGDGTQEAQAIVQDPTLGARYFLLQLTGDRAAQSVVELTGTGFASSTTQAFDVDGSGRSAMIQMPLAAGQNLSLNVWKLGRRVVATSQSTPAQSFATIFDNYSTSIAYPYPATAHAKGNLVFVADLDADGKQDIITINADSNCGSDGLGALDGVFFYRNITSGTLTKSPSNTPQFAAGTRLFCLQRTSTSDGYYEESIDHIADFNADGIPDFYLNYVALAAGARGTNAVPTFSAIAETNVGATAVTRVNPLHCDVTSYSETDQCYWQHGYIARWMDVNGDGLEDLVIARPYNDANNNYPHWRVALNQGNGTLGAEIDTGSSDGLVWDVGNNSFSANTFRYAGFVRSMDVDSDGRPELLIPSKAQGFAVKMCTLRLLSASPDTGNGRFCPGEDLGHSAGARPSSSGPLSASGYPSNVCAAWSCPQDVDSQTLTMPANTLGGGKPFLGQWQGPGDAAWPVFASTDLSAQHGGPGGDNSTYHVAALKFVVTDATHVNAVLEETPLIAGAAGYPGQELDLFGDGLSDLTTTIGCSDQQYTILPLNGTGNSYNVPSCAVVNDPAYGGKTLLPDGVTSTAGFNTNAVLYANVNQGTASVGGSLSNKPVTLQVPQLQPHRVGRAQSVLSQPVFPGLMFESINGLGDLAQWSYAPLSNPADQDNHTIPFYSVPMDSGYSDDRNFYFQSSMPAVSGMAQSDGVGGYFGFRTAIYGYQEAMYNRYGRGFSGFRTIIAETGDDSLDHRVTRTTTVYNQKFPLIGKVDSVTVASRNMTANTTLTAHTESSTYICTLASRSACPAFGTPLATYAPVLDKQTVVDYDVATGAADSETDTYYAATTTATGSGWDQYGNETAQVIQAYDRGTPAYLDSTKGGLVTTTTNTFDTSGASTSWWIDKLLSSSTTGVMNYTTTHAYPGASTELTRTVSTNYQWNTDRTLQQKTVQPGTAGQRSTTVYCYPQVTASTTLPCPSTGSTAVSYGSPKSIHVCLGTYSASGVCTGDVGTALTPERISNYTYTTDGTTAGDDGYFLLNVSHCVDALCSKSLGNTTTHRKSDGQVLKTSDANGVAESKTLDAFGRIISVDHLNTDQVAYESTLNLGYSSCVDSTGAAGHCTSTLLDESPTDGVEKNAAYRITRVEAGFPTQVIWYDVLGREIKHGHRGFDGAFINEVTRYDDLGTIGEKFAPYFASAGPGAFTLLDYDALGRLTSKDQESASGEDMITRYVYSGRITTVSAYGANHGTFTNGQLSCYANAGSQCVTMSRSQNALGQFMETSDASAGLTDYWTSPFGKAIGIKDASGHTVTASYDPLGHLVGNVDPDQGTWTFSYDALGELNSQTDARSAVTSVAGIDGLGRITERLLTPPVGTTTGLDSTQIDDIWTYDPSGSLGAVASIARYMNGASTSTWAETYAYDSKTARLTTTTTTISGLGSSMISGETYDSIGRASTHSYPDGFIAKTLYGPYGQPAAIASHNASTNADTLLWAAVSMDVWGKVTAENYTDGTGSSIVHSPMTGQETSASWYLSGAVADSLGYNYDSFGNVTRQTRRSNSATNGESYVYDTLQRLTTATRDTGATVNYGYAADGNFLYKDDFSTRPSSGSAYTYGGSGCGPHAATSVALKASGSATYNCDANGNVIGGSTITATYDLENRPTTITRVGVGTQGWTYNPLGEISTESSSKGTRYFGPAGYEVLGATGYHELGAVIVERTNSVDNITTALRDRLGSTIATIDGGVQYTGSARGYDAFGKVRNFDLSDRAGGTLNLGDSIHGFTKHDHADDVQLIHMGGRVYDYSLGRFLQVDPVLSHQTNSQSVNPYTYILNNPLSGTDPTGYMNCDADGNCTGFLTEVDKINVFKDGTVQAVTAQGATITLGNIQNTEVRNTFSAFLSGVIIGGNGAITIAGTQFGPSLAPSAIESSTSRIELAMQRGPRPLDGDATNGAVEAIASTISLGLARPLGEATHLFPARDKEQLEADNRAFKKEHPWANVLLSISINPKSLLKKLERNAAQEGIKEGGEAAVNNIVQKETRLISNVKVTDRATGKVMQGTVDLKPTLDRIKAGGSHPHPNDGSIFRNDKISLPQQAPGYYREYVHPTPGINGVGPQRIVVGQGGEIYYTPDHYATFIRVNP